METSPVWIELPWNRVTGIRTSAGTFLGHAHLTVVGAGSFNRVDNEEMHLKFKCMLTQKAYSWKFLSIKRVDDGMLRDFHG